MKSIFDGLKQNKNNEKQERELKKIHEDITDKQKLPAEPKRARGRPPMSPEMKSKIETFEKSSKTSKPKNISL
jgi:hypothetical protein